MFCCRIQTNVCVCAWGFFSPPSQHSIVWTTDHLEWPDQPLYRLYQVPRCPHRGFCPRGLFSFFTSCFGGHGFVDHSRSGARVCTLGPMRGQCWISGRISGTELDSGTWGFPPGGEAGKKGSHPLRRKCLFKLLLAVLQMTPQYSAAHEFVPRTNGIFGLHMHFLYIFHPSLLLF